jgi:hypothetical protein
MGSLRSLQTGGGHADVRRVRRVALCLASALVLLLMMATTAHA